MRLFVYVLFFTVTRAVNPFADPAEDESYNPFGEPAVRQKKNAITKARFAALVFALPLQLHATSQRTSEKEKVCTTS